jgi:hypothetical protein
MTRQEGSPLYAYTIEAVFDPYLDDRGLDSLRALFHLGTKFSTKLRILTSATGAKNLSEMFLASFCRELGCANNLRVTNREHRRFLILHTKEIVVAGFSLNNLEHNERAQRIPSLDSEQDLVFFEKSWAAANSFPTK